MTSVMASADPYVDPARYAVAVTILPGVAAGHPVTAQAGADALAAGGHAVDAAVAMMLVSCAAEMIFTGLGGGGFATVYDAATQTVAVRRLLRERPRDQRRHGARRRSRSRSSSSARPCRTRSARRRSRCRASRPARTTCGGAGAACRGPRWSPPDGWPVWGLPSRRPTPSCCRGCRRPSASGTGCRGLEQAGRIAAAGRRPVGHPDHHNAYDLLAEDPAAFYRGDFADALVGAVERIRGAWTIHDLGSTAWSSPRRARRHSADTRCSPAATTWTTSWTPWLAAGTLSRGDPRHDPEVAREPGRRAARRRPAHRDDQRRAPPTPTATPARSPRAWAWARASGCPASACT